MSWTTKNNSAPQIWSLLKATYKNFLFPCTFLNFIFYLIIGGHSILIILADNCGALKNLLTLSKVNAKKVNLFFKSEFEDDFFQSQRGHKKGLATEYKSNPKEKSRNHHGPRISQLYNCSNSKRLNHRPCPFSAMHFTLLLTSFTTSVDPLFTGYSCIRWERLLHIHGRFLLIMNFPELN